VPVWRETDQGIHSAHRLITFIHSLAFDVMGLTADTAAVLYAASFILPHLTAIKD
jgi:hypothetical protein